MASEKFQVACIESAPFGENTYVAWLDGRSDCVVVDPGLEPEKILEFLDEKRLTPAAILLTHGHGDHIGGCGDVKGRWPECPIVIGEEEAPKLTDAMLNLSGFFGAAVTSPPADVLLNEGDSYQAAGMTFEVFEIPGHSSGHIVFVLKDHQPPVVFGGDVLFAGSVGRTDFPGGSMSLLAEGIHKKLFTLPDDTVVLSGHGPPTTTGREKATNPFVGVRSEFPPPRGA